MQSVSVYDGGAQEAVAEADWAWSSCSSYEYIGFTWSHSRRVDLSGVAGGVDNVGWCVNGDDAPDHLISCTAVLGKGDVLNEIIVSAYDPRDAQAWLLEVVPDAVHQLQG